MIVCLPFQTVIISSKPRVIPFYLQKIFVGVGTELRKTLCRTEGPKNKAVQCGILYEAELVKYGLLKIPAQHIPFIQTSITEMRH